MDNVVNLRTGSKAKPSARAPRRASRKRSDKTALVLGGGGFTGGVYEIGALRALDLLTVNKSINDFDIYVGTSAGALIASFAANGITPEQMMRVVNNQVPTPFADIDYGSLMRPNLREFVSKGLQFPWQLLRVLREVPHSLLTLSPMELVVAMADLLPSGIYTGAGIEDYVREVLGAEGYTNDFRELSNELYLAATDLDTCERIVLGAEGWDDVPISSAVRASAALPMVYKPHIVKDRELIDGGIVSTTNLDIAVEAGAKFILVVNPLVPFVNDFQSEVGGLMGDGRPQRVSDLGFS
jgi:NTE family protein